MSLPWGGAGGWSLGDFGLAGNAAGAIGLDIYLSNALAQPYPNSVDISNFNFNRYASAAEVKVIEMSGCLGWCGAPGKPTYFTTDEYSSKTRAQNMLSLPSTPDYRVNFYAVPGTWAIGPEPVLPDYGYDGGGTQYYSPGAVYVDRDTLTVTPLGP